jgi:hypothetical protein
MVRRASSSVEKYCACAEPAKQIDASAARVNPFMALLPIRHAATSPREHGA